MVVAGADSALRSDVSDDRDSHERQGDVADAKSGNRVFRCRVPPVAMDLESSAWHPLDRGPIIVLK